MKYLDKKAFTLVELIVVIVILAILGTIAMMYYQSYIIDTRNIARKTDLNNIRKALDINIVKNSNIPNPSNYYTITYSGSELWKQGTFGKDVVKNLGGLLSEVPIDPLFGLEYDYSVSRNNSRIEYSLGYINEGSFPIAKNNNIVDSVYALDQKGNYDVVGNYNGFFLQTNTGGIDYILAVPEIMKVSSGSQEYFDVLEKDELVVPNFSNLPERYKEVGYISTGSLKTVDFLNKKFVIIYKGKITDLYFGDGIIQFGQNLQYAYDYTKLKGISKYNDIINFDPIHYFSKTESTFGALIHTLGLNVNLTHYFEKGYTKYAVENLYKLTEIQSNKITSVLHDNGKMWFGTNGGGIMSYDISDNKWWAYNSAISDEYPDTIYNILKDNSGKLWFTTYGKGVRIYNPSTDTWETKNTSNSGLLSNYTYGIFQDSNNNIWIGYNGGINKYIPSSNTWVSYNSATIGIPRPGDITEDNNGIIYITGGYFGNKGVSKFDGTSWINYNMKDLGISNTNNWYALSKLNDGRIIFGNRGYNLFVYDPSIGDLDDTQSMVKFGTHLATDSFVDSDNNIWIGGRSGVLKYDSNLNLIKRYHGNPKYSFSGISGITEDNNGNIWFGSSYRGIGKVNKNTDEVSGYVKKERLGGNNVYKLFADNDGFLWIGINSTTNLYKYEISKDKWSEYKAGWAAIQDIIYDNNDVLWFSTLSGICKKNIDNTFACYKESDGLKSGYTGKISVDSQNNIWIAYGRGRNFGISKFNPISGDITHYNIDNSDLSTNTIYNIFVDSSDNVWLATNDGVNMLDSSGVWHHYNTSNSNLSYDLVYDIYEDSQGEIWIVTRNGLNKFDLGTEEFTKVYNSSFYTLFEDKNNNMWFGTWNGLLKYTRSTGEYKKYLSDKLGFGRITTITQDKNGVIWYGNSRNGFGRLNEQ